MAYVQQVEEGDATGALAKVYEAAAARTGKVANIIKVMSGDGRATSASMQFYVAVMKSPNALEPARREMLATVVSNVNDCYY
ncbi:MAG: carboxymuconolactone decarboxylase family protein [Planctomycetota bacterium]|jgi:alkylhydroperoxidase family enzyme